jgi:hypothetical protein
VCACVCVCVRKRETYDSVIERDCDSVTV